MGTTTDKAISTTRRFAVASVAVALLAGAIAVLLASPSGAQSSQGIVGHTAHRVLLLGDSLGASLEAELAEQFGAVGVGFDYVGFPGTGPLTAQGEFWRDALAEGIAALDPDLVLIEASGNYNIGGADPYLTVDGDTLVQGSESFFEAWDRHIYELVRQAQDAGAGVALVAAPVVGAAITTSHGEGAEHNRGYVDLARKTGAEILDWNELLAPEGHFTQTVVLGDRRVELRSADGLHFAPDGVPVVADWLVEAVMAQLATPPSLMLVGDSITHGTPGAYTWRYFLHEQLASVYGQRDFFVGPSEAPSGGDADDYAAVGWDRHHASQAGRMLDCYLDGRVEDSACDDPSSAAHDLVDHDPDVAVVLLGTNDVLLFWGPSSPEQFVAHVEEYVSLARANNPAVAVLVMGLLPLDPARLPGTEAERAAVNAGLEELAARLDSAGARVVYAPTDPGFDPAVHTYDGVHPNTAGDVVIADNVGAALATRLGIGAPPSTAIL